MASENSHHTAILKSDELWSSYRCEGNSYAVIVKPPHDFVSLGGLGVFEALILP